MFAFLKNTTFLMILCASFAISTISLAARTFSLAAQVTALTASAASTAVAHRKTLASAVAREKAKARIRRYIAAIPVAGLAAVAYFETEDFLEWQEDNPDGTKTDYACEVADASAMVIDETLQALPDNLRPSSDFVLSRLPECGPNLQAPSLD